MNNTFLATTRVLPEIRELSERDTQWQCTRPSPSFRAGYARLTVNCVLLEKRKLDGSYFTLPNKRYKESRECVDVDAFDTDAIRRTVHEFHEKKRVSNTGQAIAGSEGEDII